MSDRSQLQGVGSLRLPVPFFDLLLALLLTALLLVSPVHDETMNADLPVASAGRDQPSAALLPVMPHLDAHSWSFESSVDHQRLTPDALAARALATHKKVVIVAPASTTLQDYLAMSAELREHGVDFGIAVKKESPP